MRSARVRLPSNMILLMKRATLRLLYFTSGTSCRRTALLRLGTFCLLKVCHYRHQKRRHLDRAYVSPGLLGRLRASAYPDHYCACCSVSNSCSILIDLKLEYTRRSLQENRQLDDVSSLR